MLCLVEQYYNIAEGAHYPQTLELSQPAVLHLATTDNRCDRKWAALGCEKRAEGEENACQEARSGSSSAIFKTLESGNALGECIAKGVQSIQEDLDREAS